MLESPACERIVHGAALRADLSAQAGGHPLLDRAALLLHSRARRPEGPSDLYVQRRGGRLHRLLPLAAHVRSAARGFFLLYLSFHYVSLRGFVFLFITYSLFLFFRATRPNEQLTKASRARVG